jgi:hypothetical protein
MSTVDDIEAAISNLPPQDFARVRDGLLGQESRLWNKQIEQDAAAGRLKPLVEEIERNIQAGRTKPLDGFFNAS